MLDLGSGAGKICFIASQVVGAEGRVSGVDLNDDMLTLARRAGFYGVHLVKRDSPWPAPVGYHSAWPSAP